MTFDLHRNLQGAVDIKESCIDLPREWAEQVKLLDSLRPANKGYRLRIRILLHNGESLHGYVGMSTGEKPCMLLRHNTRSIGGSPMPHPREIASIWVSRTGGRCLWAADSRQRTVSL